MLPFAKMFRCYMGHAAGRRAVNYYLARLTRAMYLRKAAMDDGRLLKDLAWARAHVLIIDKWLVSTTASTAFRATAASPPDSDDFLSAYQYLLMRMPVPVQY
jgi:hypothetical protein